MRVFDSGASRDTDVDKIDPEGALSSLVEERYCQYMKRHSYLLDGSTRPSDNWQKGWPLSVYMKSLKRHVLALWKVHRGFGVHPEKGTDPQDIEEVLCAIKFNVDGYLHEVVKARLFKSLGANEKGRQEVGPLKALTLDPPDLPSKP
jgi:hypothetical protein